MRISRMDALSAAALLAVAVGTPAFGQGQEQRPRQGQAQGQTPRGGGQEMQRGRLPTWMIDDVVAVRLAGSRGLAASNVTVRAEDGGKVTLTGTVPSEQARQRAEQIARNTRSVREVANELRVEPATAQPVEVSDEELAKRVAEKLASETFPGAEAEEEWLYGWEVESEGGGWADDWEFDVDVDDGTVTLEGTVDDYGDIWRAVDAARKVPGVRSVESELRPAYDYSYGYDPYDPYAWGRGPYWFRYGDTF